MTNSQDKNAELIHRAQNAQLGYTIVLGYITEGTETVIGKLTSAYRQGNLEANEVIGRTGELVGLADLKARMEQDIKKGQGAMKREVENE
jgi:hypothetical protein